MNLVHEHEFGHVRSNLDSSVESAFIFCFRRARNCERKRERGKKPASGFLIRCSTVAGRARSPGESHITYLMVLIIRGLAPEDRERRVKIRQARQFAIHRT